MGVNSIKSHLSKASVISEIRLCISADIKHEFVHVIVEGDDDIRFLKTKLSDKVHLYESYSGKLGVTEIVARFKNPNVLGICDKDYDVLIPRSRIFFYDRSSLETMLIGDYSTFNQVVNSLCSGIPNCGNVYKKVFEELRWLSLFRKINSQYKYNLKFDAISIARAFDSRSESLRTEILKEQLIGANQKLREQFECCQTKVCEELKQNKTIDELILDTNGHDCLEMLHCLCKPKKGKDHFNNRSILTVFICAYPFQSSNLYQDLTLYSEKHSLVIC